MAPHLELGRTWYAGLKYHMEKALGEKNLNKNDANVSPPYALFSYKYYNKINDLNHDKIHDFCFMGSIDSCYKRRKWVIEFAKKYFTPNSIFINTDNPPDWQSLGPFDYTKQNPGFNPRSQHNNQSKKVQFRKVQENIFYFEKMCQSKFVLCPAGDSPWSFRFYETLMCKSIPIVESWHHTYRTSEEAGVKYKYCLHSDFHTDIPYDMFVCKNTKKFEKIHMLH